ncbi:MAG: hypothetical protein AMXMBFR57_33690 [Acidimicrobiia bacterium]
MEVGGDPSSLAHVNAEWGSLANVVALADQYEFRLTLEFNPQWAQALTLASGAQRLATLRNWEARGHEIAVHHHGPSHVDWNGYTDAPGMAADSRYRGTIAQMMALLSRLPASGRLCTGGMTDESTDWPASVPYDTTGGLTASTLLGMPTAATHRGIAVTQLSYASFAAANRESTDLDDVRSVLASGQSDAILGIVFHPHDYRADPAAIATLFEHLRGQGVTVATVATWLAGRGC